MKTVRVIPQRIAIEPDGKQYSMYGSLSKGMIIKESGKYTWEINNRGKNEIGCKTIKRELKNDRYS